MVNLMWSFCSKHFSTNLHGIKLFFIIILRVFGKNSFAFDVVKSAIDVLLLLNFNNSLSIKQYVLKAHVWYIEVSIVFRLGRYLWCFTRWHATFVRTANWDFVFEKHPKILLDNEVFYNLVGQRLMRSIIFNVFGNSSRGSLCICHHAKSGAKYYELIKMPMLHWDYFAGLELQQCYCTHRKCFILNQQLLVWRAVVQNEI